MPPARSVWPARAGAIADAARRERSASTRRKSGSRGAVAAVEQEVHREPARSPRRARRGGRRMRGWRRRALSRRTPAWRRSRATRASGRAAVEQHGAAVGVLDQRRVALADVEERHGEPVRRGRAATGPRRARPPRAAPTPRGRQRARRGDARPRASLVRRIARAARRPRRAAATASAGQRPRTRPTAASGPGRLIDSDSAGQLGEARRDELEPGEQRLGEQRRCEPAAPPRPRRATEAASWPNAVWSIPIHMTGATAGSAARFAGIEASGHRLEVEREQRRGGERWPRRRSARSRRGDRAARSERARGEDPDDGGERQLPAGVARHARVRPRASRPLQAAARTTPRPAVEPRAPPARPRPSPPRAAATGPAPASGT